MLLKEKLYDYKGAVHFLIIQEYFFCNMFRMYFLNFYRKASLLYEFVGIQNIKLEKTLVTL